MFADTDDLQHTFVTCLQLVEGWEAVSSTSAAGTSWSSLRPRGAEQDGKAGSFAGRDCGVLKYAEEAATGSAAAIVMWRGASNVVKVIDGWILFTVWGAKSIGDAVTPHVVRYVRS